MVRCFWETSAKRLLGQKSILAHILVKTVNEFKGMNPKDVVDYIEGTPHISTVPVEPGLTNRTSETNGERRFIADYHKCGGAERRAEGV